jgi:hypothetical protein
MRTSWLLPAVLLLAGCHATGFDRGVLAARLQSEPMQVTEDEVRKALELRPQLALPCKVAVYLAPDSAGNYRWSGKDKEAFDAWGQALVEEGIASDVFLMSGLFVEGSSMKELRLAAARHGADALLVVKGAAQTTSSLNPAAVFNLTVVGGYLVPGSRRDALFLMQACLVDVGNGYLYASVDSEGEGTVLRPTFIIEEKDAIDVAKKRAIDKFGPELVRRMRSLRGAPPVTLGFARPEG